MQQDPLPKKSAQPSLVIAHCKYCITLQRVRKVIGFNKLGWKGLRMGCIAGAKGCGWTFGILIKTSAARLIPQDCPEKFDTMRTSHVKWRYSKCGTFYINESMEKEGFYMSERRLSLEQIQAFQEYLVLDEKSIF